MTTEEEETPVTPAETLVPTKEARSAAEAPAAVGRPPAVALLDRAGPPEPRRVALAAQRAMAAARAEPLSAVKAANQRAAHRQAAWREAASREAESREALRAAE